jgi:hypothetical protein
MSETPAHLMRKLVLASLCSVGFSVPQAAPLAVRGALDSGRLGLYSTEDFRLADGHCKDCPTIPQALWYFQDETIAAPKGKSAEFAHKLKAQDDVRTWAATHQLGGDGAKPPLLWIGSPQVAEGMRLVADGTAMTGFDGQRMPYAVTPKIQSNLSYYDASSIQHFAGRPLRMRGRIEQGRFIARTIWPDDYALDFPHLPYQPLNAGETLQSLVREDGTKALAPLAARVLWQRDPQATRQWAGRPALAIMLNGAQGDDDEAHGGHFAIATGAFGSRGEWGDWLVNNFYNLDSVSEKGIIAATLPMDAYMADLNSGQSWYRPSYMLVAVLRQERTAGLYQEAIGRVYNHFYRHDFLYRHATANCAGVSVETLRSLGWKIPEQGPTGRLKAAVALPYMAIKDRNLDSGYKAYDYLVEEQTDLYPFVAFAALGQDLLQRIASGGATTTGFERMLAEDVEALIYVRIPQFPSSRAVGQAPVASIDEYMKRAPEDKAQWKIVPVAPRPFPAALKDPEAPAESPLPSSLALYAYGGILGISTIGVWRRRSGKRKTKHAKARKHS